MEIPDPISASRVFVHEAMNTEFHLRLLGMDEGLAAGLAEECFYRIDRIEGQLSRFLETSEISRINAMSAGETLHLSDECHRCLLLAMDAARRTHGLFDVTQGARIEHRKSRAEGVEPEIVGRLMIHPDLPAVTCEEPGRMIDLGGIGKGFALDQLVPLFREWEIPGALVSAGASSMVAYGEFAWPVNLAGQRASLRLPLRGGSLSASGVDFQGSHIIHPWGDEAMPPDPFKRVWVFADSAALSEVWSTALMLVGPEDVRDLLQSEDESIACYAETDEGIVRLR